MCTYTHASTAAFIGARGQESVKEMAGEDRVSRKRECVCAFKSVCARESRKSVCEREQEWGGANAGQNSSFVS